MSSAKIVKAAVVQAEPAWFDLAASVAKARKLIAEAASNGAQIVAFPECFIPGYPTWIWARSLDIEMNHRYTQNSLTIDSDEMRELQSCAKENNIVVCFGLAELRGHSLYIGQCTIDNDGKLVMARQKLKPFHLERTIFGDGDATSLNNVATTAVGRIGQLSCGEHFNPLAIFNTCSQGEEIHVAAWPVVPKFDGSPAPYSMSAEAVSSISQVYSLQTQCFTLHSTTIISEENITKFGTSQAPVFNTPGGGNARIFAPDGRQLTTDLPYTEEGLVYADLDMSWISKVKGLLDVCGHNSRPELLWLGRNAAEQRVVRESSVDRT